MRSDVLSWPEVAEVVGRERVFAWAPGVQIQLRGDRTQVEVDGSSYEFPKTIVNTIGLFSTPTTIGRALEAARTDVADRQTAHDTLEALLTLVRIGVLKQPGQIRPLAPTVALHRMLLNDECRTSAYLQAIQTVVKPSDVVVDIGTGSGVLALAAAMCGARHVYAIEASPMAGVARQVMAANGVADKVSVIEAWSNDVILPERADVLVTELLSNAVFGQKLLSVTADAKQRLLGPNARFIPRHVRLFATLMRASEHWLRTQVITPAMRWRWREAYGMEFGPLADAQSTQRFCQAPPEAVRAWTSLSEPTEMLNVDLATFRTLEADSCASIECTSTGQLNALVLHFEATLAPGVVLSTNCRESNRPSSWWHDMYIIDDRTVVRGERVEVRVRHTSAESLEVTVMN